MILDIIIVLILLYGMMRGFHRGFSKTIFSIIGWLISIVGAFIATPFLKDYIRNNTDFYENIIPTDASYFILPEIVGDTITDATANLIFTFATFVIVFIALKLIMWLIISLITKGDRKSFAGMVDGLFGMIFGFLKGAIVVCILIAALLPITDIFSPENINTIETWLNDSYIAKLLYDNNPLYLLLEGFFNS